VGAGPRAGAFFSLSGRGEMSDLEPNFATSIYPNPGFVTISFGGSFTLHPALEVYGRVLNAFDEHYEPAFGYPALGRSALFGVRVTTSR